MNTGPRTATERRAPARLLGVVGASLLAFIFVVACGLSWDTSHKTELFRKLTVTGEFHAGGALTLHLQYEQPYEIDIRAHCLLLKNSPGFTPTPRPEETPTPTPVLVPRLHPTPPNTVYTILEETLLANPNAGPDPQDATPAPGVLDRQFDVPGDAIGRYTVRCYTPFDVNNAISTSFNIKPRPS